MKKSIFIAVVLFAFTSTTNLLFAQEETPPTRTKSNQTNERTAGYDLKKNVKCRVIQTDTGCTIVFESSSPSSADEVVGKPTSKKGYDYYKALSSYSVSAADNSVSEVVSPRDAASGLPTGKRQHKPMTVSKETNKSTPKLAESVSSTGTSSDASATQGSGGGAGKASFKEFTITKRCGGKTTKISCDGDECEIPTGDCPNGDCAITADWSWGMSQSGTMSSGSGAKGISRSSVDFFLKIEDGVCTAMAINEKGLPGEKKPKKTTTK
jgi:hypothetical protein